ncbi:hypothetical protein FRC03_012024 [Tulasnella sp. 419]|nr:hypothetical protein FRC03_012024 [Tulasnella sp. 419]
MLELSKLLSSAHPTSTEGASQSQTNILNTLTPPPPVHLDGSNPRPLSTQLSESGTNQTLAPPNALPHTKKRFSGFHFRKKHSHTGGREVVGPALQVVDADAEPTRDVNRTSVDGDHDDQEPANGDANAAGVPKSGQVNGKEEGVKVTITLEALNEEDQPLSTKNAQVTYLHIIRMGPPSTTVQDPSSSTANQVDDDSKPWVVQVVKREALIGPHTFRLQEIYGLASSSSNASEPPATTYPPQPGQQNSAFDTPASECLVCLSSPREVVLLPCRHLVACRECAVNMVEFGAGGALTHELTATGTTAEGGGNGETPAAEGGANPTEGGGAATPAAAPSRRRKRKAKGWSCPICRQPYTSLLRITTHGPAKVISDDEDEAEDTPQATSPNANADTQNTNTNTNATTTTTTTTNAPTAPPLNRAGSGIGGMVRSLLPGGGARTERAQDIETRA